MKIKELIIYPSNICNLKCKHCYISREKPTSLDRDDLEWIKNTFNPKKTIILGGEPLIYDKLEDIFKLFPETIMQISTNGLLVEENIDLLKKYNVLCQLSVEGGKKETDEIRGKGVWKKVFKSAKILKKNNIKNYIRASYHFDNLSNLKEVFEETKKVGSNVVLFPRVDLPPLDTVNQRNLFDYTLDNNGVVAQPHFMRYIGKKGRCGAGSERLNVFYDKKITPCNLDLGYKIGMIGDSEKKIKRSVDNYLENFKTTPIECIGCEHANECKGSCYVAKSYMGCPLRYRIDLGDYISNRKLDAQKVQNQVDVATDFVREIIVC
ncbi:MAG: radical SAM protein [Elusimicrobiota bacterium]